MLLFIHVYVHFTCSLSHTHTLCQPVQMVSTSDRKYRFGVPFKLLTKQVGFYICSVCILYSYISARDSFVCVNLTYVYVRTYM